MQLDSKFSKEIPALKKIIEAHTEQIVILAPMKELTQLNRFVDITRQETNDTLK